MWALCPKTSVRYVTGRLEGVYFQITSSPRKDGFIDLDRSESSSLEPKSVVLLV
jgi:hypothetical protein